MDNTPSATAGRMQYGAYAIRPCEQPSPPRQPDTGATAHPRIDEVRSRLGSWALLMHPKWRYPGVPEGYCPWEEARIAMLTKLFFPRVAGVRAKRVWWQGQTLHRAAAPPRRRVGRRVVPSADAAPRGYARPMPAPSPICPAWGRRLPYIRGPGGSPVRSAGAAARSSPSACPTSSRRGGGAAHASATNSRARDVPRVGRRGRGMRQRPGCR